MAAPLGSPPACHREVSSHLFPEVSISMAATPGHHWLEYLEWADPILQMPLQIKGGPFRTASATGSPGRTMWSHDISWSEP
jgi:mandelate racemase